MPQPAIELPCGCLLTETHVLAMCLPHDRELKKKGEEQRRKTDEVYASLRRAIEGLGE